MFEHITTLIKKESEFALDLETTGLDPLSDKLLGVALAVEGKAWYIELPKYYKDPDGHYAMYAQFKKEFRSIFNDCTTRMILHNAKFDLSFLLSYDTPIHNQLADTMVASHMVDENTRNGLKVCIQREFDYKMTTFEEVGGLFASGMTEYAEDDARQTLRLWQHYKEILREQNMLQGFYDIEMPMIRVIMEMERTGVHLNTMLLLDYGKQLTKLVNTCAKRIQALAGLPFEVGSPKQLSGVLGRLLREPYLRLEVGKNGCRPTDDRTLQAFKKDYPIIQYILNYRRFRKLNSTYIKPLVENVRADTGRLHSSFWQAVTVTGRLSSSKPINFQNIPNDKDFVVRKAFCAQPGFKLLVSDFSQIELRILAHASQDEKLLEAYKLNKDIHQQTADLVGCSRPFSKTLNFGIIYGMCPGKLAFMLGITEMEARKFMDTYFEQYPRIGEFIENTHQTVDEQRWVETLICHRRRRFDEIDGRAYRQAVNFIIQGTAAELMKKAQGDISKELRSNTKYARVKQLMAVHDEVIIEVPDEQVKELAPLVTNKMDSAWKFSIPTPCSMAICDSWDEGK